VLTAVSYLSSLFPDMIHAQFQTHIRRENNIPRLVVAHWWASHNISLFGGQKNTDIGDRQRPPVTSMICHAHAHMKLEELLNYRPSPRQPEVW
jgi:hypothetical protein